MTSRNVQTIEQRDMLAKFIAGHPLPFNASIAKGKKRSLEQNDLQWKWCTEIAAQRGDEPADYYQRMNKLHHGVPILREEDAEFRAFYDSSLKGKSYEEKIRDIRFVPVTSIMTTKQLSKYLDEVFRYWTAEGVILTQPEQNT